MWKRDIANIELDINNKNPNLLTLLQLILAASH